jgi:dTDP-4-amino-4,6-dideoxygalactose transaminase
MILPSESINRSSSQTSQSLTERANFPLQDCLHYRPVIQEAFDHVIQSGQTILAAGVRGFEDEFAAWLGGGLTAEHCIGVGNGTDALALAMHCAGIKSGDAVVVPSLTAYATVAAILQVGGRPIFVDVEAERPVIAVEEVERILEHQGHNEQRIKAVIAVHLYGEACDLRPLRDLCRRQGIALIEDCAQATGTLYEGTRVGTWGDYAAFSFYPTKNLAALGDGGMLVAGAEASQDDLTTARRLRFYGWDTSKEAVQFGVNSRLDEVQACILHGKLKDLGERVAARRHLALRYGEHLGFLHHDGAIGLPCNSHHWQHSYHLYVITVDPELRDWLVGKGSEDGIPYGVHYPLACHQHQYIRERLCGDQFHLPHTERFTASVLSLPMNPYLLDSDVELVSQHLQTSLRGKI